MNWKRIGECLAKPGEEPLERAHPACGVTVFVPRLCVASVVMSVPAGTTFAPAMIEVAGLFSFATVESMSVAVNVIQTAMAAK
jgi:hypothetical protein